MSKEKKGTHGVYVVEEFHRGDWQPILVKDGKKREPKTIAIPHDRAERMNNDSKESKTRYVLKEDDRSEEEALEEQRKAEEEAAKRVEAEKQKQAEADAKAAEEAKGIEVNDETVQDGKEAPTEAKAKSSKKAKNGKSGSKK